MVGTGALTDASTNPTAAAGDPAAAVTLDYLDAGLAAGAVAVLS